MKILRVSSIETEKFLVHDTEDGRLCAVGPWTVEFLVKVFTEHRPIKLVIGTLAHDDVRLRALILQAFTSIWRNVDAREILVHPSVMRDKVEEIQRESERVRGLHAASFMCRRLGLEEGDERPPLASFFESTFRLHRAKDIEDALIAGRNEEAERDLNTLAEDAKTWARWMLDAQLFSFQEATR